MIIRTDSFRHILKLIFLCWMLIMAGISSSRCQELITKPVTIDFKNTSIEQILKHIQINYQVNFSYSRTLINVDEKVSVHEENTPLYRILDIIFASQNIMYLQKSRIVILQPKPQNLDKLIIKGQIFDEDNRPVEYAAVLFKSSGEGRITDANGNFRAIIKKTELADTLIISSLGYEKKHFSLSNLGNNSTFKVYLKRRIFDIEKVTISRGKFKNKTWGNDGFIALGSIYIDTHGQQTVLFIENEKNMKGKIASVNYYLSKKGNTVAPFRIRLYEIDTLTGKPGKDLLPEMVVAKPKNNGGWFKVNLSEYNIQLPDKGFFAGIEGLYPGVVPAKDNERLVASEDEKFMNEKPATISYRQQLGYTRMKGTSTWHYSLANTWFQLEKNNYNVMISVNLKVSND